MMTEAPHGTSSTAEDADAARARRRVTVAIKESLRDLSVELASLNRQVGAQVELRDADFHCLELIKRHGPIGPSALARRAGLHPATMTAIIDRLQRGGWVVREPSPEGGDRRSVPIRAVRERNPELFRLYSGMNATMDELCAEYTGAELEVIARFLDRTVDAGRSAAERLAEGPAPAGR